MSDEAVETLCKTLIAIALVASAVLLIIFGHGEWVVGLFVLAMICLL